MKIYGLTAEYPATPKVIQVSEKVCNTIKIKGGANSIIYEMEFGSTKQVVDPNNVNCKKRSQTMASLTLNFQEVLIHPVSSSNC